jgi:hypothetical protein
MEYKKKADQKDRIAISLQIATRRKINIRINPSSMSVNVPNNFQPD